MLTLAHAQVLPKGLRPPARPGVITPWRMEMDILRELPRLGHQVRTLRVGAALRPIQEEIDAFQPHIVFSLLVDFHRVAGYEALFAGFLELLRVPYAGCNPYGLWAARNKEVCKRLLGSRGIPTPSYQTLKRGAHPSPLRVRYPVIVKPLDGDGSEGIARASIATSAAEVAARTRFIHETLGADALAEEYVDGRELTVGVLGNSRLQSLPVREFVFGRLRKSGYAIATERAKWDRKYQKRVGFTSRPARSLPSGTRGGAQRVAKAACRALGITGCARVDLRLDRDGSPFVIDVNPNPDLSRREDFSRAAAAAGIDYGPLLQRILRLGLRYRAPWKQVS